MREPRQILEQVVATLPGYDEWVQQSRNVDYFEMLLCSNGTAADVFTYAHLFCPRFVEVDGCVVLADRYDPENWSNWRETLSPEHAARMINHTHVEDMFGSRGFHDLTKYEDEMGELLAYFWKQAVDRQFPDAGVRVWYDDGIVHTAQREAALP